ncbi:hypothetical protein DW010_17275 [Bacteroides stercoris]|nr:hypothetical protein DW010_17275 [Bacteroides stercoris]
MFHYAATTAGCMFLFNILDTQSVACQQNKSYFRVAKIKVEIKKRPLSHLISAYKKIFYER